jgi:PAS domain S-box-containing protein
VIADTDGSIQYVNPAFEQMTGYPRDEVLGKNPRLLKSGKQEPLFYARMWETLTHGGVWSGHFTNRRKDGVLYEVEATISPIRNDDGQLVNYVATSRDVTREIQLEEQFRQTQKMEAVGRLAGGIAHDFNNLLTSILGYSRLVADDFEEGHPAKKDMEEVIHAGERAAALTKQLLAFSRKQMIEPRPINVNAIVLDMDKLLRRTLGEDVELITLIDNEMGCINADAGLIEQTIMNLAVNARDAMPKGGSLTLQTATIRFDEKQCRGRINAEPGEYVMVSVRDTGMGMSSETRDHCMEPFFTTKEKGKGTGLGLSIVYSIVKQFGGFIDIESSPGMGTDIRMYLPAVDAAACETGTRDRVALPRGTETILVVEDEETVRRLAVRILESLGYQVLQARHGGEALLICERFEKPIQLVLSDVVMPHLGGQELIERLRKIRHDFKVLYMSGFTDESFVRNAKDGQEVALLLKPFTQETLAVRVRQILDRRDA